MSVYNDDRMAARLNKWSGGRVTVLAAVCLAVGFAIHALFF